QRRVARDDVQPALPHRADDAHSLRLGTHRDVAPELLEHPARLCLAPAGSDGGRPAVTQRKGGAVYSMRRNGRYCVRSIAAGCGSWSWRQIVWLRTTFCRAIVQRSKDWARSKPRSAATIA